MIAVCYQGRRVALYADMILELVEQIRRVRHQQHPACDKQCVLRFDLHRPEHLGEDAETDDDEEARYADRDNVLRIRTPRRFFGFFRLLRRRKDAACARLGLLGREFLRVREAPCLTPPPIQREENDERRADVGQRMPCLSLQRHALDEAVEQHELRDGEGEIDRAGNEGGGLLPCDQALVLC